MTPLADHSATALQWLIRTREVSVCDVVAASLERVEQLNGAINAVVTLNPQAMDDARALDSRLARGDDPGPLCGLTVGIKDVTEVQSLRTTYGSPLYTDHVPDEDAVVVQRLRSAGAVILGKTNCPEFAAGGNTFNDVFGRTRNPWNTARTAGGSTGGGAAALATGMIALAEGTDLGGSLRIPASFCGVVGLRPSIGMVPTYPSNWAWDPLQVSGPMARTAEDVALVLQAIAGPTEWSPMRYGVDGRDFVATVRRGVTRGARIAYCADPAGIGIDAGIERLCRDAAFGLRDAGADVKEITLDLTAARQAFLTLRGLWFVTHMTPRMGRADEFGVNVGNNVRAGLATTTSEIADAERERGRLWHLFRDLFSRVDYLVTPCMAVSPFPVEQNYPDAIDGKPMQSYVDWIAPTFVLSLTGLPVSAVPCGLDREQLPVALQIVARPGADDAALALAAEVQRRHPLGRPPVVTA